MHAWQKKAAIKTANENPSTNNQINASGGNRRAIGLVPVAHDDTADKIPLPSSLRYRELLVSIEGKQSTCCLRIISPRKRSRAAILVYRGRVIGCIYGAKDLGRQLMGQEAHLHAMSDLALPDNTLDAYTLDEELVLATASLFHGSVLQPPEDLEAAEIYEWCIEAAISSDLPACIVMSDSENVPLCMTYLIKGRVVGVYSFQEGWVSASYESGLKHIEEAPNVNVSASVLDCCSAEDAIGLTFSLTGLADRCEEQWSGQTTLDLDAADIQGESQRTNLQLQLMKKTPVKTVPRVQSEVTTNNPKDRFFGYRTNHSHLIRP
jgi:hypothetical protein